MNEKMRPKLIKEQIRETLEATRALSKISIKVKYDICHTITEMTRRLDEINNLCVGFHETGPHDPEEALRQVNEIYKLSLLEESQ